jgi:hypothetical protein
MGPGSKEEWFYRSFEEPPEGVALWWWTDLEAFELAADQGRKLH